LQVEQEDKTIVNGILGPKPKGWTFFMFLHFVVAAFIVFFVIFYVKWSLEKDYQFAKYMLIGLLVLWMGLYFLGHQVKN